MANYTTVDNLSFILTQTLLEIEFVFSYMIWSSKKGVSQDTLTLIEVCI